MAQSIYITSTEGLSGKSTIVLGVIDALTRSIPRVGVFRSIARSTAERDYVLEMLLDHIGVDLDYEEAVGVTYDEVRADPDAALSKIVERFKAVEAKCDAVVIVGSDFTDVGSTSELGYNARIAANLGAPVLVVLNGRADQGDRLGMSVARTPEQLGQLMSLALTDISHQRAELFAVITNRADPARLPEINAAVHAVVADAPAVDGTREAPVGVWSIPEDVLLVAPAVRDIMIRVDGRLLRGDEELLTREVLDVVVAGMSLNNILPRLTDGAIVIVPADRTEVLLGLLLANSSGTFPSISGIILNGPFPLPPAVQELMAGLDSSLPIVQTDLDTYDTAVRVMGTRGRLAAGSQRRFDTALALFEQNVDTEEFTRALGLAHSAVVTPLMFEYQLLEKARTARKRIVLPEGTDDRVLKAAATVLARGIADLTILGEEAEVRGRAVELGLDLSAAQIVSPFDPELVDRFATEYAALRAHKGDDPAQGFRALTNIETGDRVDEIQHRQRHHEIVADAATHERAIEGDVVRAPDDDHLRPFGKP